MIDLHNKTKIHNIDILDLGLKSYQESWNFQKEMLKKRSNNEINDTLIFVEHEPVFTLGKNANENHILQNYPENIKTFHMALNTSPACLIIPEEKKCYWADEGKSYIFNGRMIHTSFNISNKLRFVLYIELKKY